MTTQTLTIGKRRFVLVPERDFQRLQKQAGQKVVNKDFAKDAMNELRAYKKTGKAANWANVKRDQCFTADRTTRPRPQPTAR